jgi:hypothetical protein
MVYGQEYGLVTSEEYDLVNGFRYGMWGCRSKNLLRVWKKMVITR